MSVHLERAQLLLGQNRYEQAEEELGRVLVEDAQNSTAHSLMSVCLLAREKFDAATEHAAEAVRLDPDNSMAHAAAAHVWLARNYLDRAEKAARVAIALDPYNANWRALLSTTLFRAQRWPEALDAANAALEVDPEHVDALNLQAAALRQLGRSAEARSSLKEALQQNPAEAWTHANLGWNCLHSGNHRDAERHFREALRLDPELEIARSGVIEAIKAKNPVYRLILRGFLRLARLTSQGQWIMLIGAFFGFRMAMDLADEHPQLRIVLWPLVGMYMLVVVLSWFTTPLSNLLLRLHPLGKLALSKDERRASNCVGGSLGAALVLAALWLALDDQAFMMLAIISALFAVPLAMTFSCAEPAARRWMWRYTLVVGVLGMATVLVLLTDFLPQAARQVVLGRDELREAAFALVRRGVWLYSWGCMLSVWAVNIARTRAWKK
jgi:tetratricopeptide (TPR) repeat protein